MSALPALPRIGYAAMTHLGLNSGVAAAEKGFETVCFDADRALIDRLGKADLPVLEPDLPELLAKNRARITFTAEAADLKLCDVVYVALDVPTDDAGKSDLAGLDRLLDLVIPALGPKATLVVLSQVPPGFTRARMRPGLSLYYQVETLIFGRAMERALCPERFIVGCADPAQPLPAALRTYLEAFGCPILPMRFESAELTKIAINCCLVSSISVANTLAELCEGIGAVWGEIAPALKLDRRIGQYAYLSPGLGIAGGNLERDLATVIRMSEEVGGDAGVVRAWIANSRHRRDWAARTIKRVLLDANPEATLAVWGLAYKENTHSVKNSPSLATLRQLPDARLVLHDPVVPASAAGHARATGVDEPLAAVAGADALMILTPWPQYKGIAPAAVAKAMRGRIVLDPYGVLDARGARKAGLEYHTLGRGSGISRGGRRGMLEHCNAAPQVPSRVVVIGAKGFVGGALVARLARERIPTLALSRGEIDLLQPGAADTFAALLEPTDSVVAVSAMAPVKNTRMLADNLRMVLAMVEALAKVPVAHVVNISSDAIYADGPLPLTEDSPAAPTSLHGAMHLARELAFRAEVKAPQAHLRPTLIYGASDPHNGYGPNRFRRLAAEGKDIVLFGEGEERRDHVYIDDVAEIVARVLARRSIGALNIATGEVHSFRDIAEQAAAISGRRAAIKGSPRSGPMPHGGYRPFDIAACRKAFPDFKYTALRDGMRESAGIS